MAGRDVNAIAGLIANAVRERLGRPSEGSASDSIPGVSAPTIPSTQRQRPNQSGAGTSGNRDSTYRQAARLTATHGDGRRGKRRLSPPSFFRLKKRKPQSQKPTHYVRDIVLLPPECKTTLGKIAIPRGSRRNKLAQSGMVGKVQFSSDMTENEIDVEICKVFAGPMGLTQKDFEEDKLFPYSYLQRPGAGSRCLCTPSVSETFEWNGKQVASLAKSGSFIYILAGRDVPGWEKVQVLFSSDEEDHAVAVKYSSSEDDLPALPDVTGSVVQEVIAITDSPPHEEHSSHGASDVSQHSAHGASDRSVSSGGVSELSLPTSSRASLYLSRPTSHRASNVGHSSSLDLNLPSYSGGALSPPDTPSLYSAYEDTSSGTVTRDPVYTASDLMPMFGERFSETQISVVCQLADGDTTTAIECLSLGPSLQSLVDLLRRPLLQKPTVKLYLDPEDLWSDMIVYYKSARIDTSKAVRVILTGQPALDTGGVRRQVYSEVFDNFASNKFQQVFEGPPRHLRPIVSSENKPTMKVLGTMVAHSIIQEGVGFPYLSPVCYCLLVAGEEAALRHVSLVDVPSDARHVVQELTAASSDEDIQNLLSDPVTVDVMDRCQLRSQLRLQNKDPIAHEIVQYEAIDKLERVISQFRMGLATTKVLESVRAFPELFVFSGDPCANDVLEAIYVDEAETVLQEGDNLILAWTQQFVRECDTDGLKRFVQHVTGSPAPMPRSIQLHFDDEPGGAVRASTCSRKLVLPRNTFASYETLKLALVTVTCDHSFNII